MINGLGVLGWGVGGIEAEAAMLGQPVSMLIPQVVGVKLTGRLREGATATDLVLTITEMLAQARRRRQVRRVFRPGLAGSAARRSRDHRQHVTGVRRDLRNFPRRSRDADVFAPDRPSDEQIALVEAYCREQGMFHDENTPEAEYSELLALDLAIRLSRAWPGRSVRRIAWRFRSARESFETGIAFADQAPMAKAKRRSKPSGGNGI